MPGTEAVRITVMLYGNRVGMTTAVLEWTNRGRVVRCHTIENSELIGACGLSSDEVRARLHALVVEALADMPMGNEASDL